MQLQSAGTRREQLCDFCDGRLPDWKQVLTAPCGPAEPAPPAVMTVTFNNRIFYFNVQPGDHGYKKFTADIKHAFGLPEDCDLNITFTCDEPVAEEPQQPSSTPLLTLQGPGAYDAAVHCASLSAARRLGSRRSTTPLGTAR